MSACGGGGGGGGGTGGGGGSSPDGPYIAFESSATNLVASDTNGTGDVFVHDRQTGTTTRVSVDSSGNESAGGASGASSISAGGRFVAFDSDATNLVGNDTNGQIDVFVYDRQTNTIIWSSVDYGAGIGNYPGANSPALSADGKILVFRVDDTNNEGTYHIHDFNTGVTSLRTAVTGGGPVISADGTHIAFRGFPNSPSGLVYVFGPGGSQTYPTGFVSNDNSNPSISGDGRFVVYSRDGEPPNPANKAVYIVDRTLLTETRLGPLDAINPTISADANTVAFQFKESNGFFSIHLYDRVSGSTTIIGAGNGDSSNASLSASGNLVTFESLAANLVPGDTNFFPDIFLYNRNTQQTVRVSVNSSGQEGDGTSNNPSMGGL